MARRHRAKGARETERREHEGQGGDIRGDPRIFPNAPGAASLRATRREHGTRRLERTDVAEVGAVGSCSGRGVAAVGSHTCVGKWGTGGGLCDETHGYWWRDARTLVALYLAGGHGRAGMETGML